MSDLIWSEAKLSNMISLLDRVIAKLEGELETFEKNFEVVRRNWSGDEYNKAEVKLLEIRKTLEKAISDQRQQKNYLVEKNNNFHGIVSGL